MPNDYKLNKHRVPFDKTPTADEPVCYEGIALNKFFCSLACGENCHGTLWGIAERTSSEKDSTSVELIEPRAMRGIVGHDFRQGIRGHFVKRDNLHKVGFIIKYLTTTNSETTKVGANHARAKLA